MSADNGIYVAEFPVGKQVEYRVIEAAAIDNVYSGNEANQDEYRLAYFGKSYAWEDKSTALSFASCLQKSVSYTEYGIVELKFDRPLKFGPVKISPPTSERLLNNLIGLWNAPESDDYFDDMQSELDEVLGKGWEDRGVIVR